MYATNLDSLGANALGLPKNCRACMYCNEVGEPVAVSTVNTPCLAHGLSPSCSWICAANMV